MFRDEFLNAMSRAANTVSVITTDGDAGQAGVTVSALSSVSADRPSLLVCIHQQSPACQAIRQNGRFCANLLSEDQADLSDRFAGRRPAPGGDKFAGVAWSRLANGSPALEGAVAAFDCTVMKCIEWGSHVIFIGDVVDVEIGRTAARALVHADREYATPMALMAELAQVA